jgi:small subunit ribosomal protein S16
MAVKLRLRQQGRRHEATYRIVATDTHYQRDGRYLEALGWYNPHEAEEDRNVFVDAARVQYWLNVGAQPTEKTESLILRAAPAVIHEWRQKVSAKREKVRAQRRARRAKQKSLKSK